MAMEQREPPRDDAARAMRGPRPIGKTALAAAIMAALLLGVVGGAAAGYYMGLSLAPPGDRGPTAGEVTFTLRAKLTGYEGIGGTIDGVRNPTLQVNLGDTVTIIIVGGERLQHDLRVEGYNVKTDYVQNVDERAQVTFVADTVGTFAYFCTVPGHRQAGMEGRLIVGSGQGGNGTLPPPGPAQPVDVGYIARSPTDLPPPLQRNNTTTVHIYMEAREVIAEIEPGTTFMYWTFNGTVPGPFFRVRVNDTVVVHFRNDASSMMTHSVDFHAVTGPGGGAVSTQTAPGGNSSFRFKALNPGLFVYHCASPHIPSHIAMGMYGLILVEPEGGLPPVDHEFYVMQGELYTRWPVHTEGHQEFDGEKMVAEEPTYVVFNGRYQALTGNWSLRANVNETVRIFFGVGGPNLISSFHVIGEIFDRVYLMGDVVSPPQQSVQTTLIAPGGAAIVDFKVQVPGTFILVDHALTRAIDKGALGILVVAGSSNPEVYQGTRSEGGGH